MDQIPATSAAETATAPAAAVEASTESNRKPGFLARLLGNENRLAEVEQTLAAEQAAHAETRTALESAQARVAEFEALEARLEAMETEAAAARTAAETAAATVPQQVASQVAAVVESLGVPETALPAQQATPPAKGEDFAHLKGLERVAAAINAKFATN